MHADVLFVFVRLY